MNNSGQTRRGVLQGLATASLVTAAAGCATANPRALGANDRMNVAVMGVRSRGKALIWGFEKTGANVTHIIDVDTRVLEEVSGEMAQRGMPAPKLERDVRRVLEDKSLDALVIATPDHWHAPAAIMAMQAGKHVYVEKPCGHNPREGELLIEAQTRYGGVVQMGNQQRSAPESIELIDAIRSGELGELYSAETWYANNRGSIGNGKTVPAPAWLDWDLWQGPAPREAYRDNLVHYNWHWFWHWGTGETCNNAAHELDIARWAMGVDHPVHVSATGSRRFFTDDDWEMYDTIDLRLAYDKGRTISWAGHSCNGIPRFGRSRGTLLYGEKGSAIVDREGYEIYDLAGQLTAERKREAASSDSADLVGADELTDLHIQNFVDTVRGTAERQHSPIDEGATSTLMCHLGNIAYRTGSDLEVDPVTGKPQSAEAMALWSREYENGWAPVVG